MIRVFLVDDHSIVRAGVRSELDAVADLEVVGEAGTVGDAVAGIAGLDPDVVVLDVHMPDGGGLAVIRSSLAPDGDAVTHPAGSPDTQPGGTTPRFLGLSVSDQPADVIALIRAGARGYVTKSIGGEELADAVRRVHSGDAVFSPRLAGYVLDAFTSGSHANRAAAAAGTDVTTDIDAPRSRAAGSGGRSTDMPGGGRQVPSQMEEGSEGGSAPVLVDALTPRETEVMRLLARGYTYREMAERLFISVKTVETHVSHVLRKTQQSNRHQLSRWVTDNRLG